MDHYKHMLVNFDVAKFMLDGGERLKWVHAWKAMILELQQNEAVVELQMLEPIRDSSYNQQILAQAMLKSEGEVTQEMSQLQESLGAMHLAGTDVNAEVLKFEAGAKRGRDTEEDDDGGFGNGVNLVLYPSGSADAHDEADEHLRDWFATHIAYPFPDKPTKSTLSTTTGLDHRQLTTWFTNMRRRSGWTDYLRSYASGDKQRFGKMCLKALKGEGDEALVGVVQGMLRYVEKRPRGKVGDWLLNVSLITTYWVHS